jgi:hypothetical protein
MDGTTGKCSVIEHSKTQAAIRCLIETRTAGSSPALVRLSIGRFCAQHDLFAVHFSFN